MTRTTLLWALIVVLLSFTFPSLAQQQAANSAMVPRLIRFGGVLKDSAGKPLQGTAGITFALYKDQEGGAALWLETQNVSLDSAGHYSILLGSTKEEGVPTELFTSGQAQWLGVHVQGQAEQPRIWMVSVPYALKAADADTLGGLPASAFVRAAPAAAASSNTAAPPNAASLIPATLQPCPLNNPNPVTTDGLGAAGQMPKFSASASASGNGTAPCNIEPSQVFDNGTNLGIGTKTPASKLDVNGSATVRGPLALPSTGTASLTHTAGFFSQPFDLFASAWKTSGTPAAVTPHFRWQAEPAGSNTASPSATLNLLFGTGALAETGLKIAGNGRLTFAAGQTFPGAVTGITAGTDLTTTRSGSTVTLNLDTTKVPELNRINTFNSDQTINGSLVVTSSSAFTSFLSAANLTVNGPGSFNSVNSGSLFASGNPSATPTAAQGAYIGWNSLTGGTGETDFINNKGQGSGGFAFMNTAVNSPNPPSTLMFINGSGNVGINTTAPAAMLDVNGTLRINGDSTMSSSPRMFFNGFFPGSISKGQIAASFVPDRAITVTRVDLVEGTVPSNCSNFGTVSLLEVGVDVFDLPLAGFINPTSGSISVNFQAGDTIDIAISAGESGCGTFHTTAQNVWVSVQYVMQ